MDPKEQFSIDAQPRSTSGKADSRRMRRAGLVPAVVYGGKDKVMHLSFDHNALVHHLENEAFYSHILTLNVKGKKGKAETVILRDLQRHPSKEQILHIDFLRVTADQEITVKVPIHFVNEDNCVGVKQQGGIVSHLQTEVEVSCLPKDLPEFLEVDIAQLDLGASLHLSDIVMPEGVIIVALTHGEASDHAIVSVIKPKVVLHEEEVVSEEVSEAEEEGEEAADEAEKEAAGKSESSDKS